VNEVALVVRLLLAVGTMLISATQVSAQAVRDRDTVTLNPDQAHIMFEANDVVPLVLMRVPTADQREAFRAERAIELERARTRYVRDAARWERNSRTYSACLARAPGHCGRVGPVPIEPTEANFELTPLEARSLVFIGPQNRFARADGRSIYVHAVQPGRYIVYGLFMENAPANGICFCFGTIAFEAGGGQITDLGRLDINSDATLARDQLAVERVQFSSISRMTVPVDARLTQFVTRPAIFDGVGKLPNFYVAFVDRIAPMAGVIRYARDHVLAGPDGNDITDDYIASMRQTAIAPSIPSSGASSSPVSNP
jgi:hypothetical protein